jgi:hypothetical protein
MKNKLFLIIVLLLPFDHFIYAPGGYLKQLAIYPIFFYFFYYLREMKIGKAQIVILLLTLFNSILFSLIKNDFSQSTKIIFVVVVFNIIFMLFNHAKKTINLDTFIKYIVWSSIIPIIFGLYQIQSIFTGFQLSFINDFIGFISGNISNNIGRLSYFQSEPAYAGIYLNIVLFLSFINFPSPNRYLKLIYSSIILLMIIFTGSVFSYFIFLFGVLGYLLCYRKHVLKYILIIFTVFLFTGVSFFNQIIDGYAMSKLNSLSSIFSDNEFLDIVSLDQSIFIRIMQPIMGLEIALNSYFLPLGIENSYFFYPDLYLEYSAYLPNSTTQIEPIINREIRTSPNNLFVKILIEFGIIGFVYFIVFWIKMMKKTFSTYSLIFPMFCVLTAVILQIDSYIYFTSLLTFLFIINETKNPNYNN